MICDKAIFLILGILDARHYYRGIKAHTIMVEAMLRLYWEEFKKWLKNEGYDYRLTALNAYLEELCSEFDTQALEKINIKEKNQVKCEEHTNQAIVTC